MAITDKDLIDAARIARESAYCDYSGFSVGAAILDEAGNVHIGCNVENAAYPLGNCAEAAAIAAMILGGGKKIVRIAVVGGSRSSDPSGCTPCGGCRQRIFEFADADTVVDAMDDSGKSREFSIAELLPAGFHLP